MIEKLHDRARGKAVAAGRDDAIARYKLPHHTLFDNFYSQGPAATVRIAALTGIGNFA